MRLGLNPEIANLQEVIGTPAFRILLEITLMDSQNELVYYSNLAKKMDYAKMTIRRAISELMKKRLVNRKWEKNENGRWVLTYAPAGEVRPHLMKILEDLGANA